MKTAKPFSLFALLFAAAALLVSCGGGGGGTPPPPPGPKAPPATGVLQLNGGTARATFSHFRAAFNNFGQSVAVWEENSGAATRILWSYNDGNSFSPEAELTPYGQNPTVATNGTDFMIIWENGYIYSRPCSSLGALENQATLGSGNYPELASNGTGYAAVWSYGGNLNASIYSGGAWSTPAQIDNNPSYIGILKMASNGTGYAVAYRDNYNQVYAVLYTGGTWSGELRLDTGTTANDPDIASSSGGYAVSWHQDQHVYASLYSTGTSTWLAPNKLDTQSGFANPPVIAGSSSGYAVSWAQSDDLGVDHIYTSLSSGVTGSWSGPVSVGSSTNGVQNPSITSISTGTGFAVAWEQSDGATIDTVANFYSAGTWTTAIQLSDGTSDALSPLAVNAVGAFGIGWYQDDGSGNPNIFGEPRNADGTATGSGLITLVQRTQLPWKGTDQAPQIATNRDGVSLAVWREYDKGVWKLYGSINNSGTWGTPFLVGTNAVAQALATNGASFMIAWSSGVNTGQVNAVTCSSSGALGTPRVVGPGPNFPDSLSMASDGSGYAVAWSQIVASEWSIYANVYSSGTWSTDGGGNPTPWLLENRIDVAFYPKIASNGRGYAAVWQQIDGSGYSIFGNVFSAGTWSTGGTLLESSANTASEPSIASNGTGYAAAWSQLDDATIWHAYANIYSGGTWSTNGTMVDNLTTGASSAKIASNGSGYAVVWVQNPVSQTDPSIYANVYSAGTWTTAQLLENGTGGAFGPSIASDGTGYAVAWSQYDNLGILSIYADTYANGTWLMNGVDPAPVQLDGGGSSAASPMITSNGSKYSAVWEQEDPLDPLAYDVQARLGF